MSRNVMKWAEPSHTDSTENIAVGVHSKKQTRQYWTYECLKLFQDEFK